MRSALSLFLGIGILSILGVAFLLHSQNAQAAPANHVVISQVQIAGTTANDEFVELYNPTANPVDLTNWRLRRESQTGASSSNLVSAISGTIPAHGYFLIAFPGEYTGSATPDLPYSATSSAIAPNNTILLYSDAGVTLVDKVGMGTAVDVETAGAPEPSSGGSVQRLLDETNGHGKDTDNNSLDFEAIVTSTPRNSSIITTTPTSTPTPTTNPSPTPTLIPSATPTITPTNTPTPSITPAPTTSPTPSPEPTAMPSMTPTTTPSPTTVPSITPTSNPSPTITQAPTITPMPSIPTPTPRVIASGPIFKCTVQYKSWRLFNKIFFFPFITCERASI